MFIGEESSSSTDHDWIHEQAHLVDKPEVKTLLRERDASCDDDVCTVTGLQVLDLRTQFITPAKDRRSVPLRVLDTSDTTYISTRFRWSVTPVLSSTCWGQNSRISSKVTRPTRNASDAADVTPLQERLHETG